MKRFNSPLTESDIARISARLTEIEQIQDLCDPDRGSDVLDNLEAELNGLINILEKSEKVLLRSQRRLRLVGGAAD